MKITFLGTGTSQGVPVIACNCEVCVSENPKDNRLRTSILIEHNDLNIVVDTGPDFREQMLREKVGHLNAVLFTHEHKDHVAGLDDVRAFNFKQKEHMPIYATTFVQQTLKREFLYAFAHQLYPGAPLLKLIDIRPNERFKINDMEVMPFEVMHGKLPVMGYRIGNFSYITDANFIPEEAFNILMGTEILVINALRKDKHHSHFNLSEAIQIANRVGAKRTYLTHISHLLGLHDDISFELPPSVYLAFDGLQLEI